MPSQEKVMLLISQEGRGDRPQLALPVTTRAHIPQIPPVVAFKGEIRRFAASGASVFDRARLDAAVSRFLGCAS